MTKRFDSHETKPPSFQGGRLSKKHWTLALCIVTFFAFFLRIDFVLNAVVDHPIRGDAAQYFSAAWNIVHHHVFSIAPPGSPIVFGDSYRDPGFPVLLACWIWIFGDTGPWYDAILITQALLSAFTIPLLLSAFRTQLPDRWLIGTGVLMVIWPHSVTLCGYLLTETLFAFLCCLSLFLLGRAITRRRQGWLVASGLCFGAAGLTNAILVPFALLLAIGMFVLHCFDRKFAVTLALSGLLLPLGWQLRNLQLPAANQTSAARAITNLVQGSWPEYHSSWRAYALGDPTAKEIQQKIGDEITLLQERPFLGRKMIFNRFANAPWHYFWWYLTKPARFWGWNIQIGQGDIYVYPTEYSPFGYNPALRLLAAICYALNPVLALLAATGCLWALLKGSSNSGIAVAMTLLALYATLIYSLLQAEPRYATPFRGVELVLAATGLCQLIHWRWKARKQSFN